MSEFDFEFDFNGQEQFTPISFQDKVEKQKLFEFEQELQGHNFPDRHIKIAERAYYKAEQRGFEPGAELDDWLEAERELFGRRE